MTKTKVTRTESGLVSEAYKELELLMWQTFNRVDRKEITFLFKQLSSDEYASELDKKLSKIGVKKSLVSFIKEYGESLVRTNLSNREDTDNEK